MTSVAGLTIVLALLLGTGNSSAQAVRNDAPLQLEPCGPEAAEKDVLCGVVLVPENYSEPSRRSIPLHLKIVKATDPRPSAAPLFHLAGGPGIAASGGAEFYLRAGRRFRDFRDIVLVDQRGTGQSSPLRCPALERRTPLQEMYPVDEVESCRRTLEAHADLTHYTTTTSARDLERVRAALGYERIDLEGISYGTELARAYLRLYPERVRAAVLIGPPSEAMRTPLAHAANAQRALDLLFHECQTDPACNAAYPDLRTEWAAVLERVDAGVRVVRRDALSGSETEVLVLRGPFAEAFRGFFTTAAQRRSVPRMIHRAAAGDFVPFLDALPPNSAAFAEGLYLSIACSEGTSRIKDEEVHRFTAGTFLGDYRVRQQVRACRAWPAAATTTNVEQASRVQHPVLALVGEFDATTPPAYAREVCAGLENCRVIEVPRMGHGPFDLGEWSGGECFDEMVLQFFEHVDAGAVSTACVLKMSPPAFLMDSAFELGPAERERLLGTYEGSRTRLVIDVVGDRLRATLFRGGMPPVASFLTPLSGTTLRLDQIAGQSLTIETDGRAVAVRLPWGEILPAVRERK